MASSTPFMSGGDVVVSDRIIYTATEFAKNNLNYLQEVGTLNVLKIHDSCRSGLSSYLFFMVLSGSGTLMLDGTTYNMKTGDCAFVDCMLNYKHRSSNELWQLKWVHFNGPSMAGIYNKYRSRGGSYVFTPSISDFQYLSTLLTTLQSIAVSASYIRDMEINESLTCLLTELMRNSWNSKRFETPTEKRKDLQKVREYLDIHFTDEIKLDNLAQIFFINKFYLTRIFKEQYGTTVNKYLTQVRITTAKKYLRFTDLSIQQISALCGYRDTNFFIRTFKKSEEMTPGDFRSKWKT